MELVNDFTVDVPVDEAWVTLTDVERIAPCLPGAQLQEVEGDVYRGVVKVKVGPILAQFKGQATFLEKDDEHHRAVLKAEGRDTGGKGNASAIITAQLEPIGATATNVKVSTDLTITGKVAQFGRGAMADISTKLLNQFVVELERTVLHAQSDAADAADAAAAATPSTTTPATATIADQPVTAAASASAPLDPDDAPALGLKLAKTPQGTSQREEAAAPSTTSTTSTTSAAGDGVGVRRIEHVESEPVDLVDVAGPAVLKRLAPLAIITLLVLVVVLLRRRKGR